MMRKQACEVQEWESIIYLLGKWYIHKYIQKGGTTVMKHEKTDPSDQTTTKVDMDPHYTLTKDSKR